MDSLPAGVLVDGAAKLPLTLLVWGYKKQFLAKHGCQTATQKTRGRWYPGTSACISTQEHIDTHCTTQLYSDTGFPNTAKYIQNCKATKHRRSLHSTSQQHPLSTCNVGMASCCSKAYKSGSMRTSSFWGYHQGYNNVSRQTNPLTPCKTAQQHMRPIWCNVA